MRADGDSAAPDERGDAGWEETVLVWNATVARITAPAEPDDEAPAPREGAAGDVPARGRQHRPSA